MSRPLRGVSNQSYRKLFRGKREKLVAQYEGEESDVGKAGTAGPAARRGCRRG